MLNGRTSIYFTSTITAWCSFKNRFLLNYNSITVRCQNHLHCFNYSDSKCCRYWCTASLMLLHHMLYLFAKGHGDSLGSKHLEMFRYVFYRLFHLPDNCIDSSTEHMFSQLKQLNCIRVMTLLPLTFWSHQLFWWQNSIILFDETTIHRSMKSFWCTISTQKGWRNILHFIFCSLRKYEIIILLYIWWKN